MRATTIFFCSVAVLCGAPLVAYAQSLIVDGQVDEWSAATMIATDPAGDAAGAFDITEVHAASQGSELFIHFKTTSVLDLLGGRSEEGTLRLEIGLPTSQHLTVDFGQNLAYVGGNPNRVVTWSQLRFVTMPTYAADRFELRLDLGALVEVGDTISVDFSGSDSLAAPVAFTLTEPPAPPRVRSAGREPGTSFRIASLNTSGGLLRRLGRSPAIGRLVQGVAADIYCFQEQGSPGEDTAARLQRLDPLGNGAAWHVHRSRGTVIASQLAIIAVPHDGAAAAVIDMGSDGAVVVFSIHPPCCGNLGSPNDSRRIAEMQGVIETIDDLRNGRLIPALLPYRDAPVIIIGDWNLVGSRTPLDLVEDPQGPHQTQWLLTHLVGSDVYTWRRLIESPPGGFFPPGRLDLLTYSDGMLMPRNGFVLDSAELPAELVGELGLRWADSAATDHLMLVGDFSF